MTSSPITPFSARAGLGLPPVDNKPRDGGTTPERLPVMTLERRLAGKGDVDLGDVLRFLALVLRAVIARLEARTPAQPPEQGVIRAGTDGPDQLIGTAGDDVLNGLAGDDTIDGRAGDDLLQGGPGADNLTGGPGADEFRYVAGKNDGTDTISDFRSGVDRIVLEVPADVFIPAVQPQYDQARGVLRLPSGAPIQLTPGTPLDVDRDVQIVFASGPAPAPEDGGIRPADGVTPPDQPVDLGPVDPEGP